MAGLTFRKKSEARLKAVDVFGVRGVNLSLLDQFPKEQHVLGSSRCVLGSSVHVLNQF